MLTGWMLKAFLDFVPELNWCKMGASQFGGIGRAFPADFFSNLRNFLLFSSPAYCLLSTAYCFSLPEANLSLNRAILSLNQANLSLNRAILSLN
jgi:hypothetical protein